MKISTAQEAINGNSNDTVITPLRLKQVLKSKNISGEGSSGGITTETDPIFTSSPAANITDEDIENWNNPPIPNVPDEVKVGGSSANISSGTDIWVKIAKNLYNQIVKSTGICLTSTGSTQNDYSYWGVSDYIEVSPSTDYVLSGINYSSTSRYMVWYDENKAIISTFARYMPTKYDYVTVKSPANAKYIRFTLFIGASDNAIVDERTTFQFEKGTVATSYMPYSGNKNTFMVNNSNGSYSDFYDLFPVNVESGVVEETDPTVPDYVKQITQEDIDKWNSGTGGSGDFDGEVEPNELIQVGVTDRVSLTISSAWQLSTIPFDVEKVKLGNSLTLTENGHIKIGSGINKVRIEGNLLVSSTAVGVLDARFYRLREGTYTNLGGYYVHLDKAKDYRSCIISIPILDVQENDEICIRVTSDTACTLTIANNAHLYVEKINETNVISGGGGNVVSETNNMITVSLEEAVEIEATNTAQTINTFVEKSKVGDKFYVENGIIKIGAGVSKIILSYGATCQSTVSSTRTFTYILHNDKAISQESYYFSNTGQQVSSTIASALIEVQEGDTFTLRCYGYAGNKILGNTGFKYQTYMTVEEFHETNVISGGSGSGSNSGLTVDMIYPIGSIYMSVTNVDPSTLFTGTTWEQIKDVFLLGAGDTYEGGITGGSDTHKHSLTSGWANINSSGKTIIYQYKTGTSWKANYQVVGSSGSSSSTSYSDVTTLGGTTDNTNNLPPYLTVYMWKRVA